MQRQDSFSSSAAGTPIAGAASSHAVSFAPSHHELGSVNWVNDQIHNLTSGQQDLQQTVQNNPALTRDWSIQVTSELRQQRQSLQTAAASNQTVSEQLEQHSERLEEASRVVAEYNDNHNAAIQTLTQNFTMIDARVGTLDTNLPTIVGNILHPTLSRVDVLEAQAAGSQVAIDQFNVRLSQLAETTAADEARASSSIQSMEQRAKEDREARDSLMRGYSAMKTAATLRFETLEKSIADCTGVNTALQHRITILEQQNITYKELNEALQLQLQECRDLVTSLKSQVDLGGLSLPSHVTVTGGGGPGGPIGFQTPKPQFFNPTKKEVGANAWVRHTESIFKAAGLAPETWVRTAIPYLTGVAAQWSQEPATYAKLTASTWDAFAEMMSTQFEPGSLSQKAKDVLAKLRFKRGNCLMTYITTLRTQFNLIGGLTESQKLEYVERTIDADLLTLIRESQSTNPDYSFEDFCSKIILQHSIFQSAGTRSATLYSLLPPAQGQPSGSGARGSHSKGSQRSSGYKASGSSSRGRHHSKGSGKSPAHPPKASTTPAPTTSTSTPSLHSLDTGKPPCSYCNQSGHHYNHCVLRLGREALADVKKKEKGGGGPSEKSRGRSKSPHPSKKKGG